MKLSLVAPLALTALSLCACQQNLPVAPSSAPATLSATAETPQRPDLIDLGNTQVEEIFSAEESLALQPLIAQAEAKIAEEDAQNALKNGGFAVQSADQGKDIDIELFLYHPKYGKKAKSWGIDNAHDFLQAGDDARIAALPGVVGCFASSSKGFLPPKTLVANSFFG